LWKLAEPLGELAEWPPELLLDEELEAPEELL
jgi:hypothetical protein